VTDVVLCERVTFADASETLAELILPCQIVMYPG